MIGPIGEPGTPTRRLADWLLHGIFKPVLEADELGYAVKRADDDASPGSITGALIIDIIEADLVVADLTGFNPNAFYELGIRHAVHKPTIHVIAERVNLPFDNKDQRTIFVDIGDIESVEAAREQLRSAALAVSEAGYKVTNPVSQAKAINALQDSADPRDQVIADLEQRMTRLEKDRVASGIIGQGELATMNLADIVRNIETIRLVDGSGKSHQVTRHPVYSPDALNRGIVEDYIQKFRVTDEGDA